jgi:hypothetical protein
VSQVSPASDPYSYLFLSKFPISESSAGWEGFTAAAHEIQTPRWINNSPTSFFLAIKIAEVAMGLTPAFKGATSADVRYNESMVKRV